MPRFFFDLEGENAVYDRVSATLPDLQAAEQFARGFADTITGTLSKQENAWRVSIQTECGKVIQVVEPDQQ